MEAFCLDRHGHYLSHGNGRLSYKGCRFAGPAVEGGRRHWIFGEGSLQGAGGLIISGQKVLETVPQLAIVAAFPVKEGGPVGRVRQIEGKVEQRFDALRIKGHREDLQGSFPGLAQSAAKESQQVMQKSPNRCQPPSQYRGDRPSIQRFWNGLMSGSHQVWKAFADPRRSAGRL
jgi:hypothetical protein